MPLLRAAIGREVSGLWRLIAHRHWITLRILGVTIRVCARCTGYLTGLFLLTLILQRVELHAYRGLPQILQVFPCLLLTLPLAVDWLTQAWRVRKSDNAIRCLTGLLVGLGSALLMRSTLSYDARVFLSAGVGVPITLAGLMGKVFSPYLIDGSLG